MTAHEIIVATGLSLCVIILGGIYFAAWQTERYRKKEIQGEANDK